MKKKTMLNDSSQSQIIQQKVQNKDTVLNVTVYPLQDAETVILLHGGPGVPNAMEQVANLLSEKYQIIYFEQRGTGSSFCNRCSYTMEDYISDIETITKYFHVDNFHLFGHSWGGLYAQIYADKHPCKVKSLFLCSPSSGTNSTWKETEKEVFQFNKQVASNGDWLKMGWYSLLGKFGNDWAYRKLFKLVYKIYHKGLLEFHINENELNKIFANPVNKTRKEIIKYKLLSVIENPIFPICITYGEKDIYGNSKNKLLERYPTGLLYEIEECGHIPWLHNPVEFERILLNFHDL